MSEVRILVQGTTPDYEAFTTFMKQEAARLEQVEPGTLVMEVFAEPDEGHVVVHELYRDTDAFLAHSTALMEGDNLQEFLRLFEIKRMTFLAGTEDDRVSSIANQLGAGSVSQIAGFSR